MCGWLGRLTLRASGSHSPIAARRPRLARASASAPPHAPGAGRRPARPPPARLRRARAAAQSGRRWHRPRRQARSRAGCRSRTAWGCRLKRVAAYSGGSTSRRLPRQLMACCDLSALFGPSRPGRPWGGGHRVISMVQSGRPTNDEPRAVDAKARLHEPQGDPRHDRPCHPPDPGRQRLAGRLRYVAAGAGRGRRRQAVRCRLLLARPGVLYLEHLHPGRPAGHPRHAAGPAGRHPAQWLRSRRPGHRGRRRGRRAGSPSRPPWPADAAICA